MWFNKKKTRSIEMMSDITKEMWKMLIIVFQALKISPRQLAVMMFSTQKEQEDYSREYVKELEGLIMKLDEKQSDTNKS